MCACTEPVRTGIGAVCVEYGRPKWPITMLNRTHTSYIVQNNVFFWHPMLVRPAMKRLFFPRLENQGNLGKPWGKKARFARAPHDDNTWESSDVQFLQVQATFNSSIPSVGRRPTTLSILSSILWPGAESRVYGLCQ